VSSFYDNLIKGLYSLYDLFRGRFWMDAGCWILDAGFHLRRRCIMV